MDKGRGREDRRVSEIFDAVGLLDKEWLVDFLG